MAEIPQPNSPKKYAKRPVWQWVVLYLIIGGAAYWLVYYFVLSGRTY